MTPGPAGGRLIHGPMPALDRLTVRDLGPNLSLDVVATTLRVR
jgi:hypothetical protein